MSQKADNGEDHKASKQAGTTRHQGYEETVSARIHYGDITWRHRVPNGRQLNSLFHSLPRIFAKQKHPNFTLLVFCVRGIRRSSGLPSQRPVMRNVYVMTSSWGISCKTLVLMLGMTTRWKYAGSVIVLCPGKKMHRCAHFCCKVVHCGIWDCCIIGFVQEVYEVTLV